MADEDTRGDSRAPAGGNPIKTPDVNIPRIVREAQEEYPRGGLAFDMFPWLGEEDAATRPLEQKEIEERAMLLREGINVQGDYADLPKDVQKVIAGIAMKTGMGIGGGLMQSSQVPAVEGSAYAKLSGADKKLIDREIDKARQVIMDLPHAEKSKAAITGVEEEPNGRETLSQKLDMGRVLGQIHSIRQGIASDPKAMQELREAATAEQEAAAKAATESKGAEK